MLISLLVLLCRDLLGWCELQQAVWSEEDTLVIVEVKTRNSAAFGNPQEFVTRSKIKMLVKAANEYLISNQIDAEVRFDIIAVLKNKKEEQIEHFENAFYHF